MRTWPGLSGHPDKWQRRASIIGVAGTSPAMTTVVGASTLPVNYPAASPPFSSMKSTTASTPSPARTLVKTNGRAPAHALGVALHHLERGADMRGEVDLVDDQEVGAGDAGAALRGNLVPRGDIDHVDREIGELRRERRREIVAAGFDQDQVEPGKFRAHLARPRRDWPKRPRGSPCAGSRRSRRRRCGPAAARRTARDIRHPTWCRCRW